MTSAQIISLVNIKPISVTALKDLSLNTTANAFIPKGTKFKLTSVSSTVPTGNFGNLNTDTTIIGTPNISSTIPISIKNPAITTLNNNIQTRQLVNGVIKRIEVPILSAIKIDTVVRNNLENISAVSNNQSSSYLGESIIAKKSQQTKNILVIIAMLAILIVAYLAVTGKLFKSLDLN